MSNPAAVVPVTLTTLEIQVIPEVPETQVTPEPRIPSTPNWLEHGYGPRAVMPRIMIIAVHIVVDISSTGFFETDAQGHMGYFPTSGTYDSSNSGSRALYTSEL